MQEDVHNKVFTTVKNWGENFNKNKMENKWQDTSIVECYKYLLK